MSNLVWAKMSGTNVWWVGEKVIPYEGSKEAKNADSKVQAVRFFNPEEEVLLVTNPKNMEEYEPKKEEFIRKGLRFLQSRPKMLEDFRKDVIEAEKRINGDENIIERLSQTGKDGSRKSIFEEPVVEKIMATPPTPSVSLTTPAKSAKKTLQTPSKSRSTPSPQNQTDRRYHCDVSTCGFATDRVNALVSHNKSHTHTASELSPAEAGPSRAAATTPVSSRSTNRLSQSTRASITKKPTSTRKRRAPAADFTPLKDVVKAKSEILADWSDAEDDVKKRPRIETGNDEVSTPVQGTKISPSSVQLPNLAAIKAINFDELASKLKDGSEKDAEDDMPVLSLSDHTGSAPEIDTELEDAHKDANEMPILSLSDQYAPVHSDQVGSNGPATTRSDVIVNDSKAQLNTQQIKEETAVNTTVGLPALKELKRDIAVTAGHDSWSNIVDVQPTTVTPNEGHRPNASGINPVTICPVDVPHSTVNHRIVHPATMTIVDDHHGTIRSVNVQPENSATTDHLPDNVATTLPDVQSTAPPGVQSVNASLMDVHSVVSTDVQPASQPHAGIHSPTVVGDDAYSAIMSPMESSAVHSPILSTPKDDNATAVTPVKIAANAALLNIRTLTKVSVNDHQALTAPSVVQQTFTTPLNDPFTNVASMDVHPATLAPHDLQPVTGNSILGEQVPEVQAYESVGDVVPEQGIIVNIIFDDTPTGIGMSFAEQSEVDSSSFITQPVEQTIETISTSPVKNEEAQQVLGQTSALPPSMELTSDATFTSDQVILQTPTTAIDESQQLILHQLQNYQLIPVVGVQTVPGPSPPWIVVSATDNNVTTNSLSSVSSIQLIPQNVVTFTGPRSIPVVEQQEPQQQIRIRAARKQNVRLPQTVMAASATATQHNTVITPSRKSSAKTKATPPVSTHVVRKSSKIPLIPLATSKTVVSVRKNSGRRGLTHKPSVSPLASCAPKRSTKVNCNNNGTDVNLNVDYDGGDGSESSLGGNMTGDKSRGREVSRPGWVIVCHNCGVESQNFKSCDRCKKVIPPDSVQKEDRFLRSRNAEAVVEAVYRCKKADFSSYSIPRTSKRAVKKRLLNKEECITLSSDEDREEAEEEDQVAEAPDKKLKIANAEENVYSDSSGSDTDSPSGRSAPMEGELSKGTRAAKLELSKLEFKKELEMDKEKINDAIEEQKSVKILCRSFRVGTHKIVFKEAHTKPNFILTVCEHGIMFAMPHCVTPTKKMCLYVPKHATLGVVGHFDSRKLSYLIFKVGNKIARYIRDMLGMNRDNGGVWFDPHNGKECEKHIVFMIEEINNGSREYIHKVYKSNLTVLDSHKANLLLVKISPPLEVSPRKGGASSANSSRCNSVNTKPTTPAAVAKQEVITQANSNNLPHSKAGANSSVAKSANLVASKPTSRSQSDTARSDSKSIAKAKSDLDFIYSSKQILTWPKGRDGITLSQADISALKPEAFLNDQILDFWLQYIHKKLLSDEDRERTHILNSFFYNRLTAKPKVKNCPAWEHDKNIPSAEKRHRRVKRWTRNVDIFAKDFIIVPINESCHWYVAVICFPGMDGPHWVNDNTSIDGYQNLQKIKGKLQFVPPPGMPPTPPPNKRRSRRVPLPEVNNDDEEGKMDTEEAAAEIPGPPVPESDPEKCIEKAAVTPDERTNAEDSTEGNDEMDGNALSVPGKQSASSPCGSVTASKVSALQEKSLLGSAEELTRPAVCYNPVTGLLHGPHGVYYPPETDPFRDEAENDTDEEEFLEQYIDAMTDSEEDPESESINKNDGAGGDIKEGQTMASNTCNDATTEVTTCDNTTAMPMNMPLEDAKETVKVEPTEVEVKVEPTDVKVKVEPEDVKPKIEIKVEVKEEKDEKPPRTDFRFRHPCILIFNSLPTFPKGKVMATLRDYLRLEYKERKGVDKSFAKTDMPGFEPQVPLQKNMSDCGVFVLEYIEKFFSQPFETYLLPMPPMRHWFPSLQNKRREIYDTISELIKTENPENLKLVPRFETTPPPPPSTPKTQVPSVPSKAGKSETSKSGKNKAVAKEEVVSKDDGDKQNPASSDTTKEISKPSLPLKAKQDVPSVITEKATILVSVSVYPEGEDCDDEPMDTGEIKTEPESVTSGAGGVSDFKSNDIENSHASTSCASTANVNKSSTAESISTTPKSITVSTAEEKNSSTASSVPGNSTTSSSSSSAREIQSPKISLKSTPTTAKSEKILLKSRNLTDKEIINTFNKDSPVRVTPIKIPRKSATGESPRAFNSSTPRSPIKRTVAPKRTVLASSPSSSREKVRHTSTYTPAKVNSSKIISTSNNRSPGIKTSPNTPKKSQHQSIIMPASQVESAPRQKLISVVPAEEPMDVDP